MLDKAVKILGLFSQARPYLSVVEVAELLDVPTITAARRLAAMDAVGFLDRDPASQRYHLGTRLMTLGHLAGKTTPLKRIALPVLKRLTGATGETSNLVALQGREAISVETVQSPRPMRHVGWAGRHIPLHATAAGKSLLAGLSDVEARALLEPPLTSYTPRTIRSMEELVAELQEIRRVGYATSLGELQDDLVGVAALVRNHVGDTVASITIGAPGRRTSNGALPHIIQSVVDAAEGMSAKLGAPARVLNATDTP